ncbi:hypothetical protein OPT61_g5872 [Boeremia exigua]|uniref:Uncharacterized protein n=1 Tax=Boeremia exigua TaxID=749465 RepID=A0ACC2I8S1_9PLEO|nr:hypothetical protein OPT61_g5872 [Boeremia exigua]
MALNGDTRRPPEYWDGKPPMHCSFESWVNKSGKDAYKDFKKDHPKTDLSYERWRRTDRVYGGYLFYVASLVWAENDDSEEESVKRRRISRVPGDNSKKIVTTNGNGAQRTAGSATPTPATNSDEIGASGKRKRKPRKKYMSQEIVASDEEAEDEVDAATPSAQAETAAAPEVTANGRRKSNSRKPRKKPLSEETISPEDEEDDTEYFTRPLLASPLASLASPLPVRSAPRMPAMITHSESPKKVTPKQASVKKSRKSFLVRLPFHLWDFVNLREKSEEMVLDEETEDASVAKVSRPATTPTKSKTGSNIRTDPNSEQAAEALTAEGTPDPSGSNTRRGLRNRKPAQQRPYYHDAQVFEDVETEPDNESMLGLSSREQSAEIPAPSKPKHFKGKGRAWKKDDSDEDEEFITPKEKKAAKAAKIKADRERIKEGKGTGDDEGEDITWALMDALDANSTELTGRTSPEHRDGAEKTNGAFKNPTKQKKKLGRPRKSNFQAYPAAKARPWSPPQERTLV